MKFALLFDKIKASAFAILPVSVVIFIISLWIGVDLSDILNFSVGVVLLILGLAIFQIGAFASMVSIAEDIGIFITKRKKIGLFIVVAFLVGFMITIAEPALWVLGDQFKAVIPQTVLILVVALGVGLFVILALVRILFQVSLRTLFIVSYGVLFIIAIIVSMSSPDFIPIAFDSGGVTTGPMAVPFIMALGFGISHARGDRASELDAFGLIGIASIGPILSVLILGLFYQPSAPVIDTRSTMLDYFLSNLVQMAIAILPFILFFIVFQMFAFKLSKNRVIKIFVAFFYTYVGLVLFLTGANGGLVNIGGYIGAYFAKEMTWLLIPLGMVFGFMVVAAEPSVVALNHQVEEVSAGAISRKLMMIALSTGVALAIGFALLRVITGISIWWIILPGYLIALTLTFISPPIFSYIAFDSGGAVSGAMTSAFLMPLALGAASTVEGSNPLTDAFGLVALVAMAPLITIQIIGIIAKRKTQHAVVVTVEDEIIDLKGASK
jgi:hypothetical protein